MGKIEGKVKEFYALLLFMQPLGWCKVIMQVFCMVTVTIGLGAVLGLLSTKFSVFVILITVIYAIVVLWQSLMQNK